MRRRAGIAPGCGDSDGARDARQAAQAVIDELRGAPDADALAVTTRFSGGGVSFDSPKVLSATHEREEGDDIWAFAYGMFELELYAAEYGISAAQYLDELGTYSRGSTDMALVTPARPGRSVMICCRRTSSTLLDVTILGDAHRYESFDLPPDANGRGRLLTLSEDRLKDAPSTLLSTTERLVLASLRCAAPRTDGVKGR